MQDPIFSFIEKIIRSLSNAHVIGMFYLFRQGEISEEGGENPENKICDRVLNLAKHKRNYFFHLRAHHLCVVNT